MNEINVLIKFHPSKRNGFIGRVNQSLPYGKKHPYEDIVAEAFIGSYFELIEHQPRNLKRTLRQYGRYVLELLQTRKREFIEERVNYRMFSRLPVQCERLSSTGKLVKRIDTFAVVDFVAGTLSNAFADMSAETTRQELSERLINSGCSAKHV